jgi:hypothetical protein
MLFSKQNHPCGFYVYAYLREDSTPYYIGKGKGKRAWAHQRDEAVHAPIDHSRIKIIAHRLEEHESFLLEILLIKQLGRKDKGTGILRNLSDGGQGPSGLTRSTETRQRMARSKKGIPSKLKGTTFSEDRVANMRVAGAKRRGKKNPKIAASKVGKQSPIKGTTRPPRSKPNVNKGQPRRMMSCIKCRKTGDIINMTRFHINQDCSKRK